MTIVSVRIQDVEDRDKVLIPEFENATKIINGNLQVFGILEKGMESGKTSVAFCAMAEDGTAIVLQTSAENFRMMAGCLAGAEQRFMDKKAKSN